MFDCSNDTKLNSFEELEIWKEGVALVKEIYLLTNVPKFEKDFALRDQIRKSAISIPSNKSEGFERNSNAEFKRFLIIAKGSSGELRTQLLLGFELGYLQAEKYEALHKRCSVLSARISSLITYLKK